MLGQHGTVAFDHVGPIVATIRHADHTHALTLVPSPIPAIFGWDCLVVRYNDSSFDVLLFDDIVATMGERFSDDGATPDDIMRAFGIDWDDVYGASAALVIDAQVISHN